MATFTLTLTEAKANALLQLIDLGVKAGGLAVAGAAASLQQDINAAHAQAQRLDATPPDGSTPPDAAPA